ncbi:MAG: glycosyltransferase [Clostridia bacterium]|nr:glycosyltransferase [Clostridia bacterium]
MKILMLLSSLGIGGAETHVLELSLALLRRGHEVTVMSAGGEYVASLKGIKHIYAPLDKKTGIVKSAKMIRRELSHGYDVMHAHSRISALAARIASRDIPLVVTAHWVFKAHFPYNVMSEWGEKTLAVSNDIKRYLIDKYNVYPDSITVTVNGVDTERFTYGERSGKIKIVSTSRLDSDRSLCASLLIDLAERIYSKSPNSEIIIVGGGDCEAELRKKAGAVNRRLGVEYITLTGATDSPEKYVKNADIFIGVSRAALEAMSAGCAVILAGNEGYLGIFDANCPTGVDSNFCCREGERASEKRLFSDICTLIEKGRDFTVEMGVKNRDFVKQNYSTEKTCSDAEGVYQSVLRNSERSAVICGYYGHGNFGDDATLIAMVALLRKNKINDITILCKNPKKVERIFSVCAKNRVSPVKISRTLRSADIFILGGGNLLQNETSTRSLYYYSSVARMAKRRGCSIFVLSGGIGGLKGGRAACICSEILSLSDAVVMRTSADFKNAKILAPFNKRIFHSSDVTDTLQPRDMSYFSLPKENYILVMPKSMPSDCELLDMKQRAAGLSADIMLLPLFETQDTAVCKKINKKIPTAKILSGLSVYEIIHLISGALHCYCGRLHALLFANRLNRPYTVARSRSEKIKNALADIEGK